MIICLKCISKECFLFNVNVNVTLNFFGGHSESTWALRRQLATQKAIGHLGNRRALKEHSGTQALKHSAHLDTFALRALRHGHVGHLDTWAFGYSGHSGTQAFEVLYLADSKINADQ